MKIFNIASSMDKRLWAILAIFGVLLLLLIMTSAPSSAQSLGVRVIDNLVPKHVPIKIKINEDKERALKDMNNDRWTSDLELEVTNTSEKPIYLLELWVEMPEIISENGHRVGFTLRYGRAAFVDFDARPVPDDKPIEPKETYVFKIEEKYQQSWAAYKAKEHKADPKRIEITFTQLSFGDGSGFNGSDAKPYPYVRGFASNRITTTPISSRLRSTDYPRSTRRIASLTSVILRTTILLRFSSQHKSLGSNHRT